MLDLAPRRRRRPTQAQSKLSSKLPSTHCYPPKGRVVEREKNCKMVKRESLELIFIDNLYVSCLLIFYT